MHDLCGCEFCGAPKNALVCACCRLDIKELVVLITVFSCGIFTFYGHPLSSGAEAKPTRKPSAPEDSGSIPVPTSADHSRFATPEPPLADDGEDTSRKGSDADADADAGAGAGPDRFVSTMQTPLAVGMRESSHDCVFNEPVVELAEVPKDADEPVLDGSPLRQHKSSVPNIEHTRHTLLPEHHHTDFTTLDNDDISTSNSAETQIGDCTFFWSCCLVQTVLACVPTAWPRLW